MPNTGKRSMGCIPCRNMKVKCDENHPTCGRCLRGSRMCTWRDAPNVFIPMDDVARKRAHHQPVRRKRKSRSPSPRKDRSESPSTGVTSLSVNSPLPHEWSAQALLYYVSEYTLPADDSYGAGFMEFLPELLEESPQGGCFKEALRAVAFVALGNRSGIGKLSVEGYHSYGRSLAELRKSLANGEQGDHILATMQLLTQYELISADKSATEDWQSHSRIQSVLIENRGPSQFDTARGRALFLSIHRSLQLKDLSRQSGPSYAPHPSFLPSDLFCNSQGQTTVDIINKIDKIMQRVREILGRDAPSEGAEAAGYFTFLGFQNKNWWHNVNELADFALATLLEAKKCEQNNPNHSYFFEAQGIHEVDAVDVPSASQNPLGLGFDLPIIDNNQYTSLYRANMAEEGRRSTQGVRGANLSSPLLQQRTSPNSSSRSPRRLAQEKRASSPDALPRTIYVFPNLITATTWTSLWVACSNLVRSLLTLRTVLDSPHNPLSLSSATAMTGSSDNMAMATFNPTDTVSQTSDAITMATTTPSTLRCQQRDYASKLMASFSYLLGEVDSDGRLVPSGHGKCVGAYFALWPLHVVAGIDCLTDQEREWVLGRLESVGKVWGIKQAEFLVEIRRREMREREG